VAHAALQLDKTGVNGAHFTLKLANSGMTSVGRAWFKSRDAYAHNNGTAPLPVCHQTKLGTG
jgi:hypothetical protein